MHYTNYKEKFLETTKLENVEMVSTVDHIFSCPPIRIFDSHHRLNKVKNNLKLLLWNINFPVEKRYKTELVFDGVFLNTNSLEYQLYDLNITSASSKVKLPDWNTLIEHLKIVLKYIYVNDSKIKDIIIERYMELFKLYDESFKQSHNSSTNFYIALLKEIYKFFRLEEENILITNSMQSLYDSEIIDAFLPELIKLTADKPEGLLNILNETEIFSYPYFREVDQVNLINLLYNDKQSITKNIDEIVLLLKRKAIMPSQTIVDWALGLANLKHFGNDYGIRKELHEYLSSFYENINIQSLQTTEYKQDGTNFINYDPSIHVYSYKLINGKFKKTLGNSSRSMNFVSAYIHLGKQGFSDACNKWWTDEGQTIIKFGKILI